jgi:hypothetical protein
MNYVVLTAIVSAFVIIAIILIFIIRLKKRKPRSKLFTGEGAYTKEELYLLIENIFKNDFKNLIKHSNKLEAIFSNPDKGRLYIEVLEDKELMEKIRKSKNPSEVKEHLKNWLEKKSENLPKKETPKIILPTPVQQDNPINIKKNSGKIPVQLQNVQTNKAMQANQKITLEKQSTEVKAPSEKIKKYVENMNSLLRTENVQKLIEIVTELTNSEVEELLNYYRRLNLEELIKKKSLTQEIIRAKSKNDLLKLLKENMLRGLNMYYEKLKDALSSIRKKGVDVKHEELVLISVPQKIKMFGATFRKEDFEKVRSLLIDLESQLNEKQKNILSTEKSPQTQTAQDTSKESTSNTDTKKN